MRISQKLLSAFVMTCVLEIFAVLFFKERKRLVGASLVCNVLTNPALNLFLVLMSSVLTASRWYIPTVLICEIAILFFEGWLYTMLTDIKKKKCYAISAAANIFSFTAGLLISALLK